MLSRVIWILFGRMWRSITGAIPFSVHQTLWASVTDMHSYTSLFVLLFSERGSDIVCDPNQDHNDLDKCMVAVQSRWDDRCQNSKVIEKVRNALVSWYNINLLAFEVKKLHFISLCLSLFSYFLLWKSWNLWLLLCKCASARNMKLLLSSISFLFLA